MKLDQHLHGIPSCITYTTISWHVPVIQIWIYSCMSLIPLVKRSNRNTADQLCCGIFCTKDWSCKQNNNVCVVAINYWIKWHLTANVTPVNKLCEKKRYNHFGYGQASKITASATTILVVVFRVSTYQIFQQPRKTRKWQMEEWGIVTPRIASHEWLHRVYSPSSISPCTCTW